MAHEHDAFAYYMFYVDCLGPSTMLKAKNSGQITSPFTQANVHRKLEDAAAEIDESLELTVQNADKVKLAPH